DKEENFRLRMWLIAWFDLARLRAILYCVNTRSGRRLNIQNEWNGLFLIGNTHRGQAFVKVGNTRFYPAWQSQLCRKDLFAAGIDVSPYAVTNPTNRYGGQALTEAVKHQ